MISRTPRLAALAACAVALLTLANVVAAGAASTVHPAPTCVEPSPCAPIGPVTILLVLVQVFSLLGLF